MHYEVLKQWRTGVKHLKRSNFTPLPQKVSFKIQSLDFHLCPNDATAVACCSGTLSRPHRWMCPRIHITQREMPTSVLPTVSPLHAFFHHSQLSTMTAPKFHSPTSSHNLSPFFPYNSQIIRTSSAQPQKSHLTQPLILTFDLTSPLNKEPPSSHYPISTQLQPLPRVVHSHQPASSAPKPKSRK
jgi:hypothetical protein